jgi:type IV pilus assembly protein PilV
MLLEALVAILIFALGVLSLVGLQTSSIKLSSQAKYRTDATMLANDLIGRMWASNRSVASLTANFATGGTVYTNWIANVQAALPGAAANPPTVTVAAVAGGGGSLPSSRVTINLFWKAPNEPAGDPAHAITFVTQLK